MVFDRGGGHVRVGAIVGVMAKEKLTTRQRLVGIDRSLHARWDRLSSRFVYIAQATVGAGFAYWFAREVVGHHQPFFAPMSVVIVLGMSGGDRMRRAMEMAIGGVLGVGFGESLVMLLGSGSWQIPVLIGLGLIVSSLLTPSVLVANQVVIGAVLIATILPPGAEVGGPDRMIDALIGSIVALLAIALIPSSPLKEARREVHKVLGVASSVLQDVAEGIRKSDAAGIADARKAVSGTQSDINAMLAATKSGREAAEISPLMWTSQRNVRSLERILLPVDNCIRNVRVMARRALVLVEDGDSVSEEQIAIIEELSYIAQRLADVYEVKTRRNEAVEIPELVHALRELGARAGMDVVEGHEILSAYSILAQSRSIIVDLLMVCGMSRESAVATLRPTSTTPAYPPELWEEEA